MLKLCDITKVYTMGSTRVEALDGINLELRRSEFVSILGPSGCGKTTLLNIIGGLDRYTSGTMSVDSVTTTSYKDPDWDAYRNKAVGFVFQTYNLIPHQSVLSNVELALTISGAPKAERRRRATEALKRVGLSDQLRKKPNQLSGGQTQRVAIARALVNNPEILLADEPTGALDTATSIQIMEILKEISKDRLVIMVTHNPELADKYSNRTIKLLDGKIVADTNPYDSTKDDENLGKTSATAKRKSQLTIATAVSLSLNNLLTKKARTILTAFAGSIGIIGIALILSLSNGMQQYINGIERDTVSGYPITIQSANLDISSIMGSMTAVRGTRQPHDLDKVYSRDVVSSMVNNIGVKMNSNDLESFKTFLDEDAVVAANSSEIQYEYDTPLKIYKADTTDGAIKLYPSDIYSMMMPTASQASPIASLMTGGAEPWIRLPNNSSLIDSSYDVIAGRLPTSWDEVVIIVDRRNEITDYNMYSLGLKDPGEIAPMLISAALGVKSSQKKVSFSYEEILNLTFKLITATDSFERTNTGWTDKSSDSDFMKKAVDNAETLKVVGILRTTGDSSMNRSGGAAGYTTGLIEHVIGLVNDSPIVKEQMDDISVDVFNGKPFKDKQQASTSGIGAIVNVLQQGLAGLTDSSSPTSSSSYDENMTTLGATSLARPSTIKIYPNDFEAKARLTSAFEDYNNRMIDEGLDDRTISYTDITDMLMSSVNNVIGGVSSVLIAFVAISLVVSSIMIGVITYISVLERTKEIGVLRSIGASKGDISHVFNAETLIVGGVAGVLGIAVTSLLIVPANIIIHNLSGIENAARLPIYGAISLVIISMVLTYIAGLIPSRMAAKKDPVVALRTE